MLLPTPDLLRGLARLAAGWTPVNGRLGSIALIRALPVTTLLEHELTGAILIQLRCWRRAGDRTPAR